MLELLARTLRCDEFSGWSGAAFRHVAPSFDPLSTCGAELHGGRWNAPGTSALYLALSPETARAELDRLVALRAQSLDGLLPRNLATVRVSLDRVADLRGEPLLRELGGARGELSASTCRSAGEMVANVGIAGLFAPSATGKGPVLVVFPANVGAHEGLELVDVVDSGWS